MRKRVGERKDERLISTSSALWQGLQSTHSWRGSGAPTGSLSAKERNQTKCIQIEQRMGWYQRPRRPVARLGASVTLFSGNIISFARCHFQAPQGFSRMEISAWLALQFAVQHNHYTISFVI